MLNVKQASCEYQSFSVFGLARQGTEARSSVSVAVDPRNLWVRFESQTSRFRHKCITGRPIGQLIIMTTYAMQMIQKVSKIT